MHRRGAHPRRHSDRRRHQPRQLGRSAARQRRSSDRGQHRHRQPLRRLRRSRLRDPGRHRQLGGPATHRLRQSAAAQPRSRAGVGPPCSPHRESRARLWSRWRTAAAPTKPASVRSIVTGGGGSWSGDIIVALDGETVNSGGELDLLLEKYHEGDTVTLSLVNDGEKRDVRVKLGASH